MTDPARIYVFGASGTGTTTLGRQIGARLHLCHVDCDDHFWAPTDPPFQEKRVPADRLASLSGALGTAGWVLSGACTTWGQTILDRATLIVFITLPTALRLERLKARETARFGDRIDAGGDMHRTHTEFMAWAASYDDPTFSGRNRAHHEDWLADQTAPICRIDATQTIAASTARVLTALGQP